ncbi:Protein lifeguard 4 [Nymphon striatum]|nr:Protein lifeguard 4 [Nymphon striatum]
MASVHIDIEDDPATHKHSKDTIIDDFMYNNNVAQANVYIRMGFLRKVYGILSIQLLFTILVTSICVFTPVIRLYVYNNEWLLTLAMFMSFVLLIAMMIKRRQAPINYILLLAFTICQAYSITVVVTLYDQIVVLEAFLLTFVVTASLTIYTFQSKRDFSSWHASLFSVLMILICASFMQLFFWNTYLDVAISIVGAIVFSLFIVYDTHMIIHRVSPEEYIMASIELYLDIINLFMYLLRILGAARKN